MTTRGRNQGELESLILNTLWQAKTTSQPGLSSQQIMELLPADSNLALTTVLTVLSRLSDKGLISRAQGIGRALVFEACETQAEHNAKLMLGILNTTTNPAIAFSHFANSLTPEQLDQLRQTLE